MQQSRIVGKFGKFSLLQNPSPEGEVIRQRVGEGFGMWKFFVSVSHSIFPGSSRDENEVIWGRSAFFLKDEASVFACRAGPKTLSRGPAWHSTAATGRLLNGRSDRI
jgi:hypothetical protein